MLDTFLLLSVITLQSCPFSFNPGTQNCQATGMSTTQPIPSTLDSPALMYDNMLSLPPDFPLTRHQGHSFVDHWTQTGIFGDPSTLGVLTCDHGLSIRSKFQTNNNDAQKKVIIPSMVSFYLKVHCNK